MANTHEMDLSHIIHDDRLNLNQTRRFAVGDIVKLKADTSARDPMSKFAIIERIQLQQVDRNNDVKLFAPCFKKATLSVSGPRPKYVDD